MFHRCRATHDGLYGRCKLRSRDFRRIRYARKVDERRRAEASA